ncbi:glutamine-hydrolyzing carbamoyl-phosphate synthase small subunit [Aminivibrio sp.]|jgi:carbamoyl-phosphate synthase small subunit|uniref:glutamine-hydrolyzing carbamoyl-phosphate synthase small subunit n=1 Tax=Aminivibrio sp. TaxID=1872489 RepID=UPI003D979DFD
MRDCYLVLEDGEIFGGTSFGIRAPEAPELCLEKSGTGGTGEIVFNTSMCGYHEMLTDPSYAGQMVVLTYPHAGNYGCLDEWSERGPDETFMPEIKLSGLIVRSLHSGPVPKGRIPLNSFLKENRVPGIQDVDTRALTLRLRDRGSCNGVLVRPSAGDSLSKEEIDLVHSFLKKVPSMEGRNLLSVVGTRENRQIQSQGSLHFTVVDCGLKGNILRELSLRGVSSRVVPWSASAEEILESSPGGVLFSNGPGDPAVLTTLVDSIRELLGKVPVFGICLGHQLITHALGGTTRKMKFGHHGCNHPVRDERTGRVLVTSQNHGFESDGDSLPFGAEVWFRNANDGSVEGLRHVSLPVLSCQFHPEAAPGPGDSLWIFDEFIKMSVAFTEKKELLSCLPAGI